MDDDTEAEILWSTEVGEGSNGIIVDDGTVYLTSKDGNLYAVDTEIGEIKWVVEITDTSDLYKPDIADGVLYIGDEDETLYAVDANQGDLLWKIKSNGGDGDDFGTGVCKVDSQIYAATHSGGVHAINSETGEQIWKFNADSDIFDNIYVNDNTVYCASMGHGIYAIDATTGKQHWFEKDDNVIYSWINDGVVYSKKHGDGIASNFTAFDLETREEKWKTLAKRKSEFDKITGHSEKNFDFRGIPLSMSFGEGGVFVATDSGNLYKFDIETGEPEWELLDITKGTQNSIGKPVIENGDLYIPFGNSVLIIDPKSSNVHDNILLSGKDIEDSRPVDSAIKDGIVYFVSSDGNLYACKTGRPVNKNKPKNPGLALTYSLIGVFVPFVAGWGQIHNDQVLKGIALCVIQVINFGLTFTTIGYILYPATALYIIYDSYTTAKKINNET